MTSSVRSLRLNFLTRGDDQTLRIFGRVSDAADKLDGKKVQPDVSVDDTKVQAKLKDVSVKLDILGKKKAMAEADVDDSAAKAKLIDLNLKLEKLNRIRANPHVTLQGADRALAQIYRVDAAIDKLSGKSAKINIDRPGNAISRRLPGKLGNLFGGAAGGAGAVAPGGAQAASGGLAALANPAGIIGGITAALVALPFAAQIAGSGIVFALGGALAGMAIYGASKTKAVRKSFDDLKKSASSDLKDIGKPFVPVMEGIFREASKVMGALTPVFTTASKLIAGPFKTFANTLLKAFAQPAVKQSITDVARAFGAILKAVTPGLAGDIGSIAKGISNIAKAVSANPGAFASFIKFLFNVAGFALNAIAALIRVATYIENHFAPAMHRIAVIFDGVRGEIHHVWNQIYENSVGMVIRLGHDVERDFNDFRHRTAVVFDGVRGDIHHIWNMIWDNTIGRLTRGIGDAITLVKGWWHNTVRLFGNLKTDVGKVWDDLWNNTVGRGRRGINDVIGDIKRFWKDVNRGYDDFRRGIARTWDTIWNNTVGRIQRGVKDAGNALNALKGAFLGPVKWVLNHTIAPLDKVWNTLDHTFGSHLPTLPTSFGFAGGGHIGRITSGTTSTADDVLIRASKDETVISAAHSAVLAPALSAVGVPGYAAGGIVGNKASNPGGGGGFLGGIVNFFGGLFSGLGKSVVTSLANIIPGGGSVLKWLASNATGKAANALESIVNHTLPAGGVGGMVRHGADDMINAAVKALAKLFASNSALGGSGSSIVKFAESFLGKIPYVFGGTSVHGDDCSGFTQMVYKHFGYNAPRTSEEQGRWVRKGSPVPGGLVFFNSPAGGPPPGHVGIVTGPGSMISQAGPQGALGPTRGSIAGRMFAGSPPGGFHSSGSSGARSGSARVAQAYARSRLGSYGWGAGQMGPLIALWNQESGWNSYAVNPSSGAAGIAQSLGHGHVTLGDYVDQINWGLGYIKSRYGSPAGAEAHEQRFNWYRNGGILTEPVIGRGLRSGMGYGFAENGPEMVTPMNRPAAGGSPTINIYVSGDTDPDGAARRIHQKLSAYKRHNGNKSLGLN